MSIPGLGAILSTGDPAGAGAGADLENGTGTAKQIYDLQQLGEYRFELPQGATLTCRLLSGTAERDGTELAPQTPYAFNGPIKTKINTWQGCTLEITPPSSENGPVDYTYYTVAPSPDETPLVSYMNLHAKLESFRSAAAAAAPHGSSNTGAMGPRIMILGPRNSGKTTLARTLAGWSTRMGRQPLVVNTDPSQGLLALPGTLSAAVYATYADPTTDWGVTPSSGPSAVPVKLPLAYHYGLERPSQNPARYRRLCAVLADSVTARLAADSDVRASGLIIDTPPTLVDDDGEEESYDIAAHVAAEFSVNIVLVVGSDRIASEMEKRLGGQPTSLTGETVSVVSLDRSDGVAERDISFLQLVREAAIREYFFGDPVKGSALNPFTQQVDFSALSVWKVVETNPLPNPERTEPTAKAEEEEAEEDDPYDPESVPFESSTSTPPAPKPDPTPAPYNPSHLNLNPYNPNPTAHVEKDQPSLAMQNRILAVLYAAPTNMSSSSSHQQEEAIRDANVMGFVYVAEADEKRRKLKVLAPVSARLGDRPLLWGSWPEPMVSLLG